jgi:GT2 family glycosyltransferase
VSRAPRAIAADVTLLVPTLGGQLLEGCLRSITAGTMWPAQLVVVDQSALGTAADCVEAVREQGIAALQIRSSHVGISAAMNQGLQHVATTYVAVTHDDCRVRPDWVERLSARLAAVGDAIVTGRVEPQGDGLVLTIKVDPKPAVYTAPRLTGDVLFPPNMGFPLRLVDRIGPFDEHLSLATAGEDNEWAHRALRAGVPIVYDPSAVVGHLARYRLEDLPALYRRYARGQGAFYGTWLRRGDRFIARRAARDLLRAPWLLLRGVATGNRELVSMGRGEITGLLPGIAAGLRNPGVRGSADGNASRSTPAANRRHRRHDPSE